MNNTKTKHTIATTFNVFWNGEAKALDSPLTLSDFLVQHAIVLGPAAITVNRAFIPKSTYSDLILKENDRIECITPMQGG